MARPLRVLVVDDEERPRVFVEELITSRGHTCVSAASLEEALGLLQGGPYAIVVTDLCIPLRPGGIPRAEHGYELERQVRARLPRERTYLIVVTGKGLGAMDSSLAHDHGCDAYVLKGDRERLLGKLAEAEARAGHTAPSARGKLPLRAPAWQSCSLVLGEAVVARTASGAKASAAPSKAVLKALYQLCWAKADEGSDLASAAPSIERARTLARDVRKFLRDTFEVAEGDDPLPRRRARKTWVCQVRLVEADAETEDYEALRRRDHVPSDDDV